MEAETSRFKVLRERDAEPLVGAVVKRSAAGVGQGIAGMILAAVGLVGGGALLYAAAKMVVRNGGTLPWYLDRGDCWVGALFLGGLGLLVMGFGVAMWLAGRNFLAVRVGLCERGFYVADANGVQVVPWDEVTAVDELRLHETPPILKGPARLLLPKITSINYTIHRSDGHEAEITKATFSEMGRFTTALQTALAGRSVPWKVEEVST